MKRVWITGYKAHELGIFDQKHKGISIIKKAILNYLQPLLIDGLEWVVISGQYGVETWAAEEVLELKKTYSSLKLAIITPFINIDSQWQEQRKEAFQHLIQHADYVNSVYKTEYQGPWQFKATNKFIMENSDGMILLFDEEKEGTPRYILDSIHKMTTPDSYKVLQISMYDLQLIAEEEMEKERKEW